MIFAEAGCPLQKSKSMRLGTNIFVNFSFWPLLRWSFWARVFKISAPKTKGFVPNLTDQERFPLPPRLARGRNAWLFMP
ncbi:hypothetical protein [Celeribacter sp.]|uniref:hypothetical protein n=1 Tax=Celeribacter sp. TaxID=1890673 RepID=UPI003A8F4CA1